MTKVPILTSTNVKELSRINLIVWVNSLELLEQPISDIRELDDARFFVKLMAAIFPGNWLKNY